MKPKAYRSLPTIVLAFALLPALGGPAAADENPRQPGRGARDAALPVQAASCGACVAAQERCTTRCFGVQDKTAMTACLIGCDNAAANCSCDERVTLRSEDVLPRPDLLGAKAAACNGTVTCGTEYSSCASWSAYYDCGDPFCAVYRWCGDQCADPTFGCFGPAMRQSREQYRVCFNAQGQSCTEYRSGALTVLGCGC
jgi:hypothetical protein